MPATRRPLPPVALALPLALLAACTTAPRGRVDVEPHAFRQRVIDEAAAHGVEARFGVDAERRETLTVELADGPGADFAAGGERVAVITLQEVAIHDLVGGGPPRVLPLPSAISGVAVHVLDDGAIWVLRGRHTPLIAGPDDDHWTPEPNIDGRVLAVRPDGERVVVARDRKMYLLRREDGAFVDVRDLSSARDAVAFGERHLYIASRQRLQAFDGETGELRWSFAWPYDADEPAIDQLAVRAGWIRAHRGARYVYVPVDAGGKGKVVRDRPRSGWCTHAGPPQARVVCFDEGRAFLYGPDGAAPLPPGVLRATMVPGGEQVLIARHDGLWLMPLDDRRLDAQTYLGPLPTRTVTGAIEADGDGVWAMGFEGADRPPLPVFEARAARRSPEPVDGGSFFGAFTRLGATLGDAPTLDTEMGLRLTWSLGARGGDRREPTRGQRLMLGGQLGFDMSFDGEGYQPDLRLALPLVYRARATAVFDGTTYVGGHPLSVVLEPGVSVVAGDPDLTLSVTNETWGGGFVRLTWDRSTGAPVFGLGLEGGSTPTQWVALGLAATAIVYGLANADWEGFGDDAFCHRCGPMWQND